MNDLGRRGAFRLGMIMLIVLFMCVATVGFTGVVSAQDTTNETNTSIDFSQLNESEVKYVTTSYGTGQGNGRRVLAHNGTKYHVSYNYNTGNINVVNLSTREYTNNETVISESDTGVTSIDGYDNYIFLGIVSNPTTQDEYLLISNPDVTNQELYYLDPASKSITNTGYTFPNMEDNIDPFYDTHQYYNDTKKVMIRATNNVLYDLSMSQDNTIQIETTNINIQNKDPWDVSDNGEQIVLTQDGPTVLYTNSSVDVINSSTIESVNINYDYQADSTVYSNIDITVDNSGMVYWQVPGLYIDNTNQNKSKLDLVRKSGYVGTIVTTDRIDDIQLKNVGNETFLVELAADFDAYNTRSDGVRIYRTGGITPLITVFDTDGVRLNGSRNVKVEYQNGFVASYANMGGNNTAIISDGNNDTGGGGIDDGYTDPTDSGDGDGGDSGGGGNDSPEGTPEGGNTDEWEEGLFLALLILTAGIGAIGNLVTGTFETILVTGGIGIMMYFVGLPLLVILLTPFYILFAVSITDRQTGRREPEQPMEREYPPPEQPPGMG